MLAGQREATLCAALVGYNGKILELAMAYPRALDQLQEGQAELVKINSWESHLAAVDQLLEKVETDPRQKSLDSYHQWEDAITSAAKTAGWNVLSGHIQDWIPQQGARIKELEAELQQRAGQIGVACLKHDLTHSLACGHCLAEAESRLSKPSPAVVAIEFSLATDDGDAFLRLWLEGDWETIRKEWPDAPETVFVQEASHA